MKEDFKAIKGFDNYLIGSKGTVLNINPYHKTLAVEAGKDNSVSRTAISSCAIKRSKGIKATSCGYIWEYLNEGQTTIENT